MGSKKCLLEDACSPSLAQDPGPPLRQKSIPCVCVCVCMCVRVCVLGGGDPQPYRGCEMGPGHFLHLSTTDLFFGPFVVRPHPIHFRTSFSTIFGLISLGASHSLLVTTVEDASRHHRVSFGGKIALGWGPLVCADGEVWGPLQRYLAEPRWGGRNEHDQRGGPPGPGEAQADSGDWVQKVNPCGFP